MRVKFPSAAVTVWLAATAPVSSIMTIDTGAVRGTVTVLPMVFGGFPANPADASPTRLPCIVSCFETPTTGAPVGRPMEGIGDGAGGLGAGFSGLVGLLGTVGVVSGAASLPLLWQATAPVSITMK